MVTESVFVGLSIIILIAVAVSFVMRMLRQPLIIGYILTGIIVSPYFLDLVGAVKGIETFAQMGVAVLLFMVGLNLNPKIIRDVGKVALITGIGQIIFTFIIGFALAKVMGFGPISAAYLAIAISFSSTVIIMKLLSDKGDINSLYGKISIGFLIVQDLVAILVLMFISSLSKGGSLSSIAIEKLGTGALLITVLVFVGIYILPTLTKFIAKSQELLFLFSIAWALAIASLFNIAGFSIEIGALLAGITLSTSNYRYEIGSKIKPIRDFFLLTFFILLGSQVYFASVREYLVPAIAFSLLVLVGNPLIVMFLMGRLGYTKRNSFLAGLTVSQISEFSFILVALGVSVGHLPQEVLSLITVIGLLTMGCSAYAIMKGKKLYYSLRGVAGIFEKRGRKIDEGKYHRDESYDIILFGYNRIGYSLKKSFRRMKKKFLIVDNNPEIINRLASQGIDCRYGDAEDFELLEELPLKNAKMIISTIPELDINMLLLNRIMETNKEAVFIAVSHQTDDALALYKAGASYIITPHFFGGVHTANLLEKHGLSRPAFDKEGEKEARDLIGRKKEGHKDTMHERD